MLSWINGMCRNVHNTYHGRTQNIYMCVGQWQVASTKTSPSTLKTNNYIRTDSSEYHCLQIVKKFDYENYLASLFIPSNEIRRTAFALRAFNVDLSQIRDLTKTDNLAQIRFQFWSDIIDDIYKNKNHFDESSDKTYKNFPVAAELQIILSKSNLSKHWLRKVINIRRETVYLQEFPFQTLEELEKYCESCFGSIYYLLNEKIIENSTDKSAGYRISLDHVASHLGKAQGLTNILRGVKHNAISRRCYIPNDVLINSNCTHEDFLRGNVNESVCNAVFEVATNANNHLKHSIKLLNDLKGTHGVEKCIYLPYIPIKTYLESLEKANFNLFDEKLYRKNGYLPWKLWWRSKFFK